MAGTLPDLACCPETCEDPLSVAVPGPEGDAGEAGDDGAVGASAYTSFTAAFTMPLDDGASSAVAALANTSWMAVNQIVFAAKADGSVIGTFQVTAIGGATSATLKNLEDAATGVYAANSAPGQIFTIGSMLVPSGYQGTMGAAASTTLVGDVTGTVGANLITKNATLGSILVGNGTSAQSLAKGTDGQIPVSDATAVLDVTWKSVIPITGDANIAENRVPRLSAAIGLPIPLEASQAQINPPGSVAAGLIGAFVLDASYGNVRGTDAVDLQASHSGVAQVASGAQSAIGGGRQSTASGAQSTVSGGDINTASGVAAAIGGGAGNLASNSYTTIPGGNSNIASAIRSTVGGGLQNTASADSAVVAGGTQNVASASVATVGGGNTNIASGIESVVSGGASNEANALDSVVCGGFGNLASGIASVVQGGQQNIADKFGQVAWGSGRFSTNGDAQASKVVMRIGTTGATPAELFLDGAAARLVVPTGKSWMFQIMLVARRDTGTTSIYKSEGLITNVAGVVTCPAAPTTTEIYDGIGLPATPVVVTADDPNNSLIITVTGVAANNIRWVASAQLVEVAY